jgi:hypothetical protein
MNRVKALVRVLYLLVRFVSLPLILLLRPTGIARDRLVVSFTSFAVLLLFLTSARFSPNVGLAVLGVGALLAYLFAMWGKEFEAQ